MRHYQVTSIFTKAMLLVSLSLLVNSCTNRIIKSESLDEPIEVFLIDHGRHPSLILPRKEGGWVRYAYGDWAWYAEGRESIFRALAAIAWPTKGALGRRVFAESPGARLRYRVIPEGYVDIWPIAVELRKVRLLERDLEAIYVAGKDHSLWNHRYNLEFVPHPQAYWFANQSNLVMVQWLESLGLEVEGLGFFSNWQLP